MKSIHRAHTLLALNYVLWKGLHESFNKRKEGFFLKLFLSISILDSSQKWSGIPDAGSKLTSIPDAEGEGWHSPY